MSTGRVMGRCFVRCFPAARSWVRRSCIRLGCCTRLRGGGRGVYTGAIGCITPDRRAEFSVAIRTLSLRNGCATLGVGSGITYDSVAEEEYAECRTKTRFVTARSDPDFALVETLLLRQGAFPLLERHLERQGRSAALLSFRREEGRGAGGAAASGLWAGWTRVRWTGSSSAGPAGEA